MVRITARILPEVMNPKILEQIGYGKKETEENRSAVEMSDKSLTKPTKIPQECTWTYPKQ